MESIRIDILNRAIGHTAKARPSVYGSPHENMSAQIALIDAFEKHNKGRNGRAHDMAIHSLLIKIGRIASGSYHRDNYEDGAAYLAIAGECAELEAGGAASSTRVESMPEMSGDLRQTNGVPSRPSEEVEASVPLHEQGVRSTVLRSG